MIKKKITKNVHFLKKEKNTKYQIISKVFVYLYTKIDMQEKINRQLNLLLHFTS